MLIVHLLLLHFVTDSYLRTLATTEVQTSHLFWFSFTQTPTTIDLNQLVGDIQTQKVLRQDKLDELTILYVYNN